MKVNGLDINVFEAGAGEALLFLHGWGSSFTAFQPFLDGLAPFFRVLALDLPGFGRSQEPPAPWAVADYAAFVLAFLREMGVGRVILVGHSFGGRVIIKLAGQKNPPLDIPKIILIDSAGLKPRPTWRKRARGLVYKAGRLVLEKRWPALAEAWRRRHGSADYLAASPVMRQTLVKAVNEDLTPLLPLMAPPTLLIWGENDTATPLSDGRLMERLIPGGGLALIKGAGHYSFLDSPRLFGRVLDSFLDVKRG